jgi:MFS family permease
MRRSGARAVIAVACAAAALGVSGYVVAGSAWWLVVPTILFGVAIGAATTAAYTAASSVIPSGARGSGFGLLTTASLVGLAVSPIASGLLAATSIRAVFVVDAVILGVLAILVKRLMITAPAQPTAAPAVEG